MGRTDPLIIPPASKQPSARAPRVLLGVALVVVVHSIACPIMFVKSRRAEALTPKAIRVRVSDRRGSTSRDRSVIAAHAPNHRSRLPSPCARSDEGEGYTLTSSPLQGCEVRAATLTSASRLRHLAALILTPCNHVAASPVAVVWGYCPSDLLSLYHT